MPDNRTPLQQVATMPPVQRQAHLVTDMIANPSLFEHMQRAAQLFAQSTLVPEHMRSISNCFIALNIARRMEEDPLTVMQNIYVVNGRPGWHAQYMVARANRSGVFVGRLNWRVSGGDKIIKGKRRIKTGFDKAERRPIYREETADFENFSVVAFATLADTGEEVSAKADMMMAIREGWITNEKYVSMPDHMLKMRSATMLIRLYCPEVMLGLQTTDEAVEMPASEPIDITPRARPTRQRFETGKDPIADAEVEAVEEPAQEEPGAAEEPPTPPIERDELNEDESFQRAQVMVDAIQTTTSVGDLDRLEKSPRLADAPFLAAQQRDWVAGEIEAQRDKLLKAAQPKPKTGQAALTGLEP